MAGLAARMESAPEQALAWAWQRFGERIALASSFGAEDVVLLDLALSESPEFPVFAIDTGRLPEETFEVAERWRRRGARIRWLFPERSAVEALESMHGLYSFREGAQQRRACCAVRKVEPLRRALCGLSVWVTGLRRGQGATRERVQSMERDPAHGLLKLNPLATWTEQRVWDHLRSRQLPYSALHDRGYPSVGCAPCTRAIQPGEHPRAGRWWWETAEHKECGLHLRGPSDGSGERR